MAAVAVCRRHGAPIVSRGGGTSLAGECTNTAVVIDWSKYCHRPDLGRPRRAHLRRRARHRARPDQRPARAAPAGVRARAGHPRPLHARRDDRQQLLRRDGAAHRQGRRQRRRAGGAALRRHPDVGRGDRRRRVRARSSAAAAAGRRSTAQLRALRDEHLAAIRAPLTRTSRAGCRATTSTACCPRRASTSRRRWSAPRARWSRCCGPKLSWCRGCQARTAGVPRLPRRRRRRRRGAVDPPLRADRPGGPRRQADHLPAGEAPQPGRADRAAARAGLPAGADRRRRPRTRPTGAADAMLARPRQDAGTTTTSRSSTTRRWRSRCGWSASPGSAPPRACPACPTPGPAGRTPPSPPTTSATTCATCRSSTTSSATGRPRSTGTSGRAACTPASRSTCRPPTASPHYRRFVERAADLVASYGGSFSGEHGDGQQRGELLPKMFGDRIDRGVRPVQGDLRPGRPDEPRQGRAAVPAGRARCGWASTTTTAASRPRSATPTTTAASAGRCCAASVWASAAATRAG